MATVWLYEDARDLYNMICTHIWRCSAGVAFGWPRLAEGRALPYVEVRLE